MSPSVKRQRLDAASDLDRFTVLLNQDLLRKITSFLDLPAVNAMSVVCREWQQVIWQNHNIWKQLLLQRYPNLQRALPAETLQQVLNGGRNTFLQAITMQKDKMRPVRESSLPVALQRKISGEFLLDKWQPEAVIFFVDIWKGPVGIVSESVSVRPGNVEFSQIEVQVEDSAVIQAIEETLKTVVEDDSTPVHVDSVPLFAKLSFFVRGENVPICDPITLLSEPGPFFVSTGRSPSGNCSFNYRSDVENCWVARPGFDQ